MTGSEFLTYVKNIYKRTDKDSEIYEATADIIADVRLRIKTQDYAEEAFTTGIASLGDYQLGLPSDFGHLIGDITLIDVDADQELGPLRKISKQTYDEMYGDRLLTNEDEGEPRHFCIYAEQVYLGPVPDKITYKYQLNYTTEDYAAIAAGTDPVPFTDRYRVMLRAGVLYQMFCLVADFERADKWQAEYERELVKLKAKYDDDIKSREPIRYSGV